MQVKLAPAGFVVSSEEIPGAEFVAQTLVEARLPAIDIHATSDPLVRHLLATGACATYRIPDTESGDFVSGGLAVTPKPHRLIDASAPRRCRTATFQQTAGLAVTYSDHHEAVVVEVGVSDRLARG